MEGNRIFIEKNKYVIKKAERDTLRSEKIFIDINTKIKTQKIVDYNEAKNYIIYKYIKGDIIHELNDVDNCLTNIYKIINKYKKINIKGYGNFFNLKEKWTDFLKDEVEKQSKFINDDSFKIKVLYKIKILENYNFKKSLIHGDLGAFNVICRNKKIKGIIDPRALIGDPIYDFIYFIFSSYKIAKEINFEEVLTMLQAEPKEKIIAMSYIMLYDRIAKEQKNNTKYKEKFYKILNKIEKIELY